MKMFCEIHLPNNVRRIEAMTTPGAISHFKIKQEMMQTFAHEGILDVRVYEHQWEAANPSHPPTDNARSIALLLPDGSTQLLMHGWSKQDLKPLLVKGAYFYLFDLPSAPDEHEGGGTD